MLGVQAGWLPPDPGDMALERAVNQRLGHASIKLSRREPAPGLDPGDNTVFVLVMAYFAARKVVEREYAWFDADELVKAVELWINVELPRYREMDNWEIAH
jgi:hypothetical protein